MSLRVTKTPIQPILPTESKMTRYFLKKSVQCSRAPWKKVHQWFLGSRFFAAMAGLSAIKDIVCYSVGGGGKALVHLSNGEIKKMFVDFGKEQGKAFKSFALALYVGSVTFASFFMGAWVIGKALDPGRLPPPEEVKVLKEMETCVKELELLHTAYSSHIQTGTALDQDTFAVNLVDVHSKIDISLKNLKTLQECFIDGTPNMKALVIVKLQLERELCVLEQKLADQRAASVNTLPSAYKTSTATVNLDPTQVANLFKIKDELLSSERITAEKYSQFAEWLTAVCNDPNMSLGVVQKEQLSYLENAFKEAADLSQKFCNDLENLQNDNCIKGEKVLTIIEAQQEMFKLYQQKLVKSASIFNTMANINSAEKENFIELLEKHFTAFLTAKNSDYATQSANSFFILPTQRLPRIQIFANDLLKNVCDMRAGQALQQKVVLSVFAFNEAQRQYEQNELGVLEGLLIYERFLNKKSFVNAIKQTNFLTHSSMAKMVNIPAGLNTHTVANLTNFKGHVQKHCLPKINIIKSLNGKDDAETAQLIYNELLIYWVAKGGSLSKQELPELKKIFSSSHNITLATLFDPKVEAQKIGNNQKIVEKFQVETLKWLLAQEKEELQNHIEQAKASKNYQKTADDLAKYRDYWNKRFNNWQAISVQIAHIKDAQKILNGRAKFLKVRDEFETKLNKKIASATA